MIPSKQISERMMTLVGADTATLATAATPTEVQVHLSKTPFTPSPTIVFADLTPPDFDGYAHIAAGAPPWVETLDPASGAVKLLLPMPAGGLVWETTGTTNLPQTIYGYMVIGHSSVNCGAALFNPPIVLTGVNQSIIINQPALTLIPGAVA